MDFVSAILVVEGGVIILIPLVLGDLREKIFKESVVAKVFLC